MISLYASIAALFLIFVFPYLRCFCKRLVLASKLRRTRCRGRHQPG